MSGAQAHGAIEWVPTRWAALYDDVYIVVEMKADRTWAWSATKNRSLVAEGNFANVMTAQRAAANWFINWQKEQANK